MKKKIQKIFRCPECGEIYEDVLAICVKCHIELEIPDFGIPNNTCACDVPKLPVGFTDMNWKDIKCQSCGKNIHRIHHDCFTCKNTDCTDYKKEERLCCYVE